METAEILKTLRKLNREYSLQEKRDFKYSILKYNTYKVRIDFHENQHSKVGSSDTFYLEGFENLFNIVNIYNFQNAGIKKISIYGIDEKITVIKTKTFKGNYQEALLPKNYFFNEFVSKTGHYKI